MLGYLRRNKTLTVGLILVAAVLLFAGIGRLVWDVDMARPLSGRPNQRPSWDHPLGTDRQARDLFAVMIVGTPKTLYIGLLAGFIGVVVGTALALIAAYSGGIVDSLIRSIVDIGLTIPTLLVLVLLAVARRSLGQPDGTRRRVSCLALADSHHPLPGLDDSRTGLRPGRSPIGRTRPSSRLL
jgi:peptide/nickel transport system permease protein